MHAANRPIFDAVLHDLIHRIVNTLHHARENETGLHPVLVGVDTNHEPLRAALTVLPVLLNSIECAEAGIAGCCENNVGAFLDLGAREFFAFDGIVPGRVRYADIIGNHADLRIDRLRAFFIAELEFVDQRNVHAAHKTEDAAS